MNRLKEGWFFTRTIPIRVVFLCSRVQYTKTFAKIDGMIVSFMVAHRVFALLPFLVSLVVNLGS